MAISTVATSASSSTNSTIPPCKFDVFLSFRGKDTRTGFTDHLHAALQQRGIITFIDDELERGEVISDQLLQAIDKSLISIVILSENYASSRWCLDELQRILESKKSFGRKVIPVFYKIDPFHVRRERGTFADAFRKHDERYPEKVQGWRDALKEVANLSGHTSANKHETKLIKEIVTDVWTKLPSKQPYETKEFVGIDSKAEYLINSVLRIGLNDVRLIGIWGVGGIGKTTLARAVYHRIRDQFDLSYFYVDVNEVSKKDRLANLQKKFLSHCLKSSVEFDDAYEGRNMIRRILGTQKVLIVLDDASEISQLEYLAIKQDWLGPGSRVIVTTRDKQLLIAYGGFEIYEAEFLNDDESLQMFCQWAFKSDKPEEDYLKLSRSVIKIAAGLPLTLKVLGCHLCGRKIIEWEDALEEVKKTPPDDVFQRLQISYEALDRTKKEIFLDIACCFKGMHKAKVIQILEVCGFHPTIGIRQLVDKCLLVEHYNGGACILSMHDILQEMAKRIVREEAPEDAGRRSRLWSKEDINHVLAKNKGTKSIKVIHLQSFVECEASWHPEAFSMMSNLRILIISCNVCLPNGLKCLPSSLKILEWEKYPCKSLPIGAHPNELVELKMHHSKIIQLWKDTQISEKLRFIDLSYSEDLIRTPDFSMLPNLERLLLEGCIKLAKVHPSLGDHKKVVAVNLKDCKNLKALPRTLEMDSLNELILSGCSELKMLPKFGENMKYLSILELKNCKSLVRLPGSLRNLKSLKSLNTFGCSKLLSLPENLDENESIEELDISGTAIREIPSSINYLKNLRLLHANRCTSSACDSSQNLLSMTLKLFGFNSYNAPIRLTLPASISCLSSLKSLSLVCCNLSAGSIPNDFGCLPSLEFLNLSGNNFGSQIAGKCVLPPSFLSLSSLKELLLNDCNLGDGSIPDNLCALSSLTSLQLARNNFTHLPDGLVSNLLALKSIVLSHCNRLLSLPSLPPNIKYLQASGCHPSMELLGFLEVLWKFLSRTDFDPNLRRGWRHLNLFVPGSEVPSWFHIENINFLDKFHVSPDHILQSRQFSLDNENPVDVYVDSIVSIKVDISRFCDSSARWGVLLCFVLQDIMPTNSSNPKSSLYIIIGRRNDFPKHTLGWKVSLEGNKPQLFFWFLHSTDVKGNSNLVELIIIADRRLSAFSLGPGKVRDKSEGKSESGGGALIKKYGWRVTSKEELEEWRRTRVRKESGEEEDSTSPPRKKRR